MNKINGSKEMTTVKYGIPGRYDCYSVFEDSLREVDGRVVFKYLDGTHIKEASLPRSGCVIVRGDDDTKKEEKTSHIRYRFPDGTVKTVFWDVNNIKKVGENYIFNYFSFGSKRIASLPVSLCSIVEGGYKDGDDNCEDKEHKESRLGKILSDEGITMSDFLIAFTVFDKLFPSSGIDFRRVLDLSMAVKASATAGADFRKKIVNLLV